MKLLNISNSGYKYGGDWTVLRNGTSENGEAIYNKIPIAVTPIGDSQELIKENRGIEIKGFDSSSIASNLRIRTSLDTICILNMMLLL